MFQLTNKCFQNSHMVTCEIEREKKINVNQIWHSFDRWIVKNDVEENGVTKPLPKYFEEGERGGKINMYMSTKGYFLLMVLSSFFFGIKSRCCPCKMANVSWGVARLKLIN